MTGGGALVTTDVAALAVYGDREPGDGRRRRRAFLMWARRRGLRPAFARAGRPRLWDLDDIYRATRRTVDVQRPRPRAH